jgi:multiple sugar transport system permease protein
MINLKSKFKYGLRKEEALAAITFIAPWLIGLLLFQLIPIGYSLYASFTDWSLIKPKINWVGLDNYIFMFSKDLYFITSITNTLKYVLLTVIPSLVLGLGIALVLNQKIKGMNAFRTILYAPVVIPIAATSILWLNLFNFKLGPINVFLQALGVSNPPNWLANPAWFLPAVAIISLWGVGGGAIIFLAGLQNINHELYEAAEIDGANSWHKFFWITLPMVSPTLFFMLITGLVGAFEVFAPAFILGTGAGSLRIGSQYRFYMLNMYINGFTQGKLGYASALGWVYIVIVAVTIGLVYKFAEKYVYYETGR